MRIPLGMDAEAIKAGRTGFEASVHWDTGRLINGHTLIAGKSGTGKTWTLRKMISAALAQDSKTRIHIVDTHGDIDIPGSSSVKFSESTGYGFNPLEINSDHDFGGVRKRIQQFISAINRTSRQLGTKQEAVLRALLQDIYASNGFHDGKPETWSLEDGVVRKFPKKHPTLADAVRFSQYKLKGVFLGVGNRAVTSLEAANRKMFSFQRKARDLAKGGKVDAENEALRAEIERLKSEAIDAYSESVCAMETGKELDDLLKYDSRDVLKSVCERLENINAVGVFKDQPPPFDKSCGVWRYDIRSLAQDEKKLFAEILMERLFVSAVERGVCDGVRDIIILDEAHNYLDDTPDNIANKIAKEARKFGVALVCASQSPTHFSDDFLSNVGCKMILGLDEMFWEGTIRRMRIDRAALEWIRPHRSMMVQLNHKGEARSRFIYTVLKDAK